MDKTLKFFDLNWFCRYPRSEIITCDIDSEFSSEFITLLKSYSIQVIKLTRRNLQLNTIIERIH